MSGLNVIDASFVISFFFFIMTGGTIAYGDFFYDYDTGSIIQEVN